MPRLSKNIEFQGTFETEVLGTFQIIRGFALLEDLAAVSVPYLMGTPAVDGLVDGYQRPLDEVHAEDVRRYFEQGDQRFVPEVILSIRVPLVEVSEGGKLIGVACAQGGVQIYRSYVRKTLPAHTVKIERAALETLREQKRIRRIDGNHRLAKAAQLKPVAGQSNRYKAPFCFLLLGDVGVPALDYTEALIFHTINSTAKPLDAEQALQLILGQPTNHTQPPHLEFALSPALHFTRLLDEKLRMLPEPMRTRLGGRSLSRISVASKELLHCYPNRVDTLPSLVTFRDEIVGALSDVCTHLHPEVPEFCTADYFIELATHVWMRTSSTDTHAKRIVETVSYLREMALWMGTDGMRSLTSTKPLGRQLTDIYDAVRSRVPRKVFLARWYPTTSDGDQLTRANNRLNALRQLVEGDLKLELVDMGTKEGGTFPIHQRMYEAIGSSEIFIADLTGLRANVMIELGYALNQMHQGRLLLLFSPMSSSDKVPFDTNTFRYEQINEAADIPSKLKPHLQQILADAKVGRI